MKKLNTKLKLLSMALVGLGGLALAGSAAAQSCPSGPVAWTSSSTLLNADMSIESGGLGNTSCRLDVWVNAGASAAASATVYDSNPASEKRYRVQFIINLDNLPNPTLSTGAQLLLAQSAAGESFRLTISGIGGQWYVTYFMPDAASQNGVKTGAVPLDAGENRVEFDLQIGASGSLSMWINSSNEGSPTLTATSIDNSALQGIDETYMGLSSATPGFVATYAGSHVQLDQFDSRRQTFIGF